MQKLLLGLVGLCYPMFIYFGLLRFDVRAVAIVLGTAATVRFVFSERSRQSLLLMLIACAMALITLVSKSELSLLLYPTAVNISLLAVFMHSLFAPPTVIEQFARRFDPEFSDAAVPYARKVTWVWSGFFVVNAVLSVLTVFVYREFWVLYNGLLSYVAMALLFAIEYMVRRKVKQSHA